LAREVAPGKLAPRGLDLFARDTRVVFGLPVNGFVIRIDAGLGDDLVVEPVAAERRGREKRPALVVAQALAELAVPSIAFYARGFVDPQTVKSRGDEVERVIRGLELDQDVALDPERVVGTVVVLDRRTRKDLIHIA